MVGFAIRETLSKNCGLVLAVLQIREFVRCSFIAMQVQFSRLRSRDVGQSARQESVRACNQPAALDAEATRAA